MIELTPSTLPPVGRVPLRVKFEEGEAEEDQHEREKGPTRGHACRDLDEIPLKAPFRRARFRGSRLLPVLDDFGGHVLLLLYVGNFAIGINALDGGGHGGIVGHRGGSTTTPKSPEAYSHITVTVTCVPVVEGGGGHVGCGVAAEKAIRAPRWCVKLIPVHRVDLRMG